MIRPTVPRRPVVPQAPYAARGTTVTPSRRVEAFTGIHLSLSVIRFGSQATGAINATV
jgi:hypothetical protein